MFPFVFVMAVSLLGHRRFPAAPGARSAAVAVLLVATTILPADPVGTKRWVEDRSEVGLLAERDDLRELAEGKFVYLDFGDVLSRNYLAYVLRRDLATIRLVGDQEPELVRPELPEGRGRDIGTGDIVISRRDDPWSSRLPDLEVGDFIVHVSG